MATPHTGLPDEAEFLRMEGELFGRLERGHRRRVITHRLGAAAIVVALSGGTVAAATVASETRQSNLAYCYASADGSGAKVSVSTATQGGQSTARVSPAQTHRARVTNAVARCAALWRGGLMSRSGTPLKRSPRLQACILNSQEIAVYPNLRGIRASAFCGDLGLSAP